jgi:DUF1009 family protein
LLNCPAQSGSAQGHWGLAGIGIEAGRVIIVDRDTTLRKAKEAGLFIVAQIADDPQRP